MKRKTIIMIVITSIFIMPVTILPIGCIGFILMMSCLNHISIDTPIFGFSSEGHIVDIEVIHTYKGELSAEEVRSRSGITFPSDTLFIRDSHGEGKNNKSWFYTSKEPFKLPENVDVLNITTLKNQTYYLMLGGVGNLCWRSDEKPFKLPVDLDELYSQNNMGFANKEALVSRVKELEAKGEEWVAESNLELKEKIFSSCFKTNIIGATEAWWADWTTNGLAFRAQILKTPEKYYLDLWSRRPD